MPLIKKLFYALPVVFLFFETSCAPLTKPLEVFIPYTKEDAAVEENRIATLRADLDEKIDIWKKSMDDPYSREELKQSYIKLQDVCRDIAQRKGGFPSAKAKAQADIVKYPYDVFFNELFVDGNGLKKQLFDILTPGTAANDYYVRPSDANLANLKNLFEEVHKYYVGVPYTWQRYYNKYLFAKSRLEHFKAEWEQRDAEYRDVVAKKLPFAKVQFAENRARYAYNRFKQDCKINNLPLCCQVNAFYMSHDIHSYYRLEKEENEYAAVREREGRQKEVVIFVHGLGGDRSSWGGFPILLAREDIKNKSLKKYFKVYVFRYDTAEDAKSVEGFKRELAGFISDIIKIENVPQVNLIGHSFGGVTSLKYFVHYLDEPMKDFMNADPSVKAKKLVDGYLSGNFKRTVKRFVGIGPSFSGSEMANIMADIFNKETPLYQRDLPFFKSGIPVVGDMQVMENQIGSAINLLSFKRLDYERPLDPESLLNFLNQDELTKITDNDKNILKSLDTKVLNIIGDPFSVVAFLKKSEDDGLIKCFSANLNHLYLSDGDGKNDIGYKGAQDRYVSNNHNEMIDFNDRNRIEYKYTVSFLNDELINQDDPDHHKIENFLVVARVYPNFIDYNKYEDMCFRETDKVYYTEKDKYEVPRLEINAESQSAGPVICNTENAGINRGSTNPFSGVFFFEGSVQDCKKPGNVVFKLKANGFKTKYVSLKVEGGKVTYAPNLVLEKE